MCETIEQQLNKPLPFTNMEVSEMYITSRTIWTHKKPDSKTTIKTIRYLDDGKVRRVNISKNTTVDTFSDVLERADIGTYAVFTALTKRKPTMLLRVDSYEKIAPNQWSAPEYRIPVRVM